MPRTHRPQAHFDDRDRRRYKSNLSGESKLGRYVLDADGRPYRESIGLGVLRFPERRSEPYGRGGAGWAPIGDESSWLEQARREAAAREAAEQAGGAGRTPRSERAWLTGDAEAGSAAWPSPSAGRGTFEGPSSGASAADVGWAAPSAAASPASGPAHDVDPSGWGSSAPEHVEPRPSSDAPSSSTRPAYLPTSSFAPAHGPSTTAAPARASQQRSNPLMTGIMATIEARKAEVNAAKKARLKARSRWN